MNAKARLPRGMRMDFVQKLFEDAPEELKLQAIKTNAAWKSFQEKHKLFAELLELEELVKAQRASLRLEFEREERIYQEMINSHPSTTANKETKRNEMGFKK